MLMINNNIYWYVLFVRTGSEERVVKMLKRDLSGDEFSPFIPKKECIFRRQGKKSIFQKICFPSYVFIETSKTVEDFLTYIFPIIYRIKDAYRFLSYNDDRFDIAMREDERRALDVVLGDNRCIDISAGFKEGDSVRVISGALAGCESEIVSINKNRKDAVISMNVFGNQKKVSVGLDIIENLAGGVEAICLNSA